MITDKLAKSAISAPLLTIDYTKIPSLYLLLQCDYLPIESSSHKAIKQLNESFHFHDFLQLIRNSSLNILSTQWHIDWPLTLHFLNNNSISANKSSTSFPQYWYCTFKYKIFCNELPMLSQLYRCWPDLYNSFQCLLYDCSKEIQEYLWFCIIHHQTWTTILLTIMILLFTSIKAEDRHCPF